VGSGEWSSHKPQIFLEILGNSLHSSPSTLHTIFLEWSVGSGEWSSHKPQIFLEILGNSLHSLLSTLHTI